MPGPNNRKHHQGRPIYQAKATFAADQQPAPGQQQQQQPQYHQQYQPKQNNRGGGQYRGVAPMNNYNNNNAGGGMMNYNQIMPIVHKDNIDQMDKGQLEGVLLQLVSMCSPELLNQITKQSQGLIPQQQYKMDFNVPRPININSQPQVKTQAQTQQSNQLQPTNQMPIGQPPQQYGKVYLGPGGMMPPMVQNYMNPRSKISNNLCETHFPEPVMFHLERPVCRKCIPEYMKQQQQRRRKNQLNQNQVNLIAQGLGISTMALNTYQTEKNMVSRSLEKIQEFRNDHRYYEMELKEREEQSENYLNTLPNLMSGMFDHLEALVGQQEQQFYEEITNLVKKQQENIRKDIERKVPGFTQRLSQKYTQLQQASQIASQQSEDQQIQVLEQYYNIFTDLDAEFEKYFNEFESIGKLQRLVEKDPNEIIKEFNDLVEGNLRVDFNVKNSFGNLVGQRLHSFQWNQRYAQIYKVKTNNFEKRMVTMDQEVPLYSRSIAIESGQIYLIGGYIKRQNMYLKKCYRFDEIFNRLEAKSDMVYPHADHSLCAIESFIFVVGTFVNNQVYGYSERYDCQKDKWKVIAPLNIPRSGVALCSFKNQYLFAFGGRVDQKRIVDIIEVYDIKRNSWQEIPSTLCDKTKWIPAYMSLAYQITDKEIMIFGGKSALTFQIFNGVFVFDIEKMEVVERGSLVNPCSYMNTPLVFNHHLYAFGNDIYIHKYSIPEQKWTCIPKAIL